MTRHRPPVVSTVLVVVNLRLGVQMIVVVTENRVPWNLETGCVVDGGVHLVPKWVDITRYAVLVEVVAEGHNEIGVRLRGVRRHESSDR